MVRLGIGAGHGGNDPGAVDRHEVERDLARIMCTQVINDARRAGAEAVDITVEEGYPGNVDKPPAIANAAGVDYAMQLHFNAGGGDGTEVLYWSGDADGAAKAQAMAAGIAAAAGIPNRGAKARGAELGFLRNSAMTALMPEFGFVDDPQDDDVRKVIGAKAAVSAAVLAPFGLSAKAPSEGWPLQMYTPNNTDAQKFAPIWNADGTVSFRCRANGKMLDVTGGSKEQGATLQLWPGNGTAAQKFRLVEADVPYQPDTNKPYIIVPMVNEKLCLDVQWAGTEDGTLIQTFPRNSTQAQYWYLVDQGDAQMCILNPHSMKCIDAVGGGR